MLPRGADCVVMVEDTEAGLKDGAAQLQIRRAAAPGQAALVGLKLRPRRMREASAMWQAVTDAVGAEKRDALWSHPDLVPTQADIDNPQALIARLTAGEPEPCTAIGTAPHVTSRSTREPKPPPSGHWALWCVACRRGWPSAWRSPARVAALCPPSKPPAP